MLLGIRATAVDCLALPGVTGGDGDDHTHIGGERLRRCGGVFSRRCSSALTPTGIGFTHRPWATMYPCGVDALADGVDAVGVDIGGVDAGVSSIGAASAGGAAGAGDAVSTGVIGFIVGSTVPIGDRPHPVIQEPLYPGGAPDPPGNCRPLLPDVPLPLP